MLELVFGDFSQLLERQPLYPFDFNAAPAEAWLPKVKQILGDYGVTRTDKELLDAITLCKGDAREILYTTQRMVARV